jgi:putative tricarboxylic transport membrane protein
VKRMARHDRYTSLILGAFGLYVAFEGWRLQVGAFQQPKAGFMIFWAGIVLAGLSAALLLNAVLRQNAEEAKPLWQGAHWQKGAKGMAALFCYALIFRWAGFLISTFLLLLFLLKGIEPQKWRVALVISVVTIALCYLIFVLLLEVQFPAGMLGAILS